ncbi:MAG TPA: glycosyltransferase, partial [Burkholderiaceae bacterium]|nr:glycosyltransferase [Burkholderiaceae bacterium]
MKLAVVVPVFNEAAAIEAALARLTVLRERGAQVMVVDGGSSDATAALAKPYADRVLQSARGRAQQLNAGAKAALDAGADVLLFVHADSELPDLADHLIDTALRSGGRVWG